MPTIVALFGMMIAGAGMLATVSPERFIRSASRWFLPSSVWAGIIPRALLATALWLAADVSRMPIVFMILALGVLVSGVALLLTGTSGLRSRIAWLRLQPTELTREWAVGMVAFGGFLVWAVFPALPIPWGVPEVP